jgi:glutathione synthase/RimK-type ligase-like ATP-grasp enzyme
LFTHRLEDRLTPADFADVRFGSSILQRRIDKASDVRVCVIGTRHFACEILSQRDVRATTDWRVVPVGLEHRPIEMPEDVSEAVELLRRALGLASMQVDFAVDKDGRWWFLEANPNGQWLWVQLLTGMPLDEAYADLLAHAVAC